MSTLKMCVVCGLDVRMWIGMSRLRIRLAALVLAASVGVFANGALAEGDPTQAGGWRAFFENGKPHLNLRYRYEYVDQAGLANNAHAHTIRTRLGFTSGEVRGFSFLVEGENVSDIGAEKFNDTVNGKSTFPVVADPDATEINRAEIRFSGIPKTKLAAGRQWIVLDNARFVGDVGFRQNQQTFDAVSLVNTTVGPLEIRYDYMFGVQRIFGDDARLGDFNTDNHMAHLTYTGFADATVVGYGYLIDIDDSATLSSRTFGLRASGHKDIQEYRLGYAVEFARQSEHADNPSNFDVDYYLIEPRISRGGVSAWLGYEVLEGNGASAFQTPLATLHKFQGFADRFLTTPANGVEDAYVGVKYVRPRVWLFDFVSAAAIYHDFEAENSSAGLGDELDAVLSAGFHKRYKLTLKAASYDADTFSTDTDKVWIQLDAAF